MTEIPTPRWYQRKAVDDVWAWFAAGNEGNPCIELPTGCHARGQLVVMYDGSMRAVEDVVVGDRLMGPDGKPRNVLRLCRGHSDMWRITPKRYGRPFVVNGEHILSLSASNRGDKYPCQRTGGQITNISVREYVNKPNNWKHIQKLYHAPSIERFDRSDDWTWQTDMFNSKPRLPPRFVGMMLGDGSIGNPHVAITTMDQELSDYAQGVVDAFGDRTVKRIKEGNRAWSLHINGGHIREEFRKLGLFGLKSHDKYIPTWYKTAPLEDRLLLLAGLIDTDGARTKNGYDYISKSRSLAEDVAFVARSAGLSAHVASCRKGCQTGAVGTYWRVSLNGECWRVPVMLERKAITEKQRQKRAGVSGFTIERVEDDEFFGFTLDGDHLYLLDDFTVTHNSGKSVVAAIICKEAIQNWPGTRVLLLSHVKEILEQDAERLRQVWPGAPLGIYSAGLKKRELGEPITFGSVQSLRDKALALGFVDIVICDECHLISHKDEGSYRSLIAALRETNPNMRVIGLTATPYRMGHGMITDEPAIFSEILRPATIQDLLKEGHVAPLRSKHTVSRLNVEGVKVSGGDYVSSQLQKAVDTEAQNREVADEIVKRGTSEDCLHWIVFASGIEHAEHLATEIRTHGIETVTVHSKMTNAERDARVLAFKSGKAKCLVNVAALTTGFDFPDIDLLALVRPTLSVVLYQQIIGRGLRPKSHRDHALVLDFAGAVARHGPVTNIRPPTKKGKKAGEAPVKTCDFCDEIVHISARVCPSCGEAFPEPETAKDKFRLHDDDIMGERGNEAEIRTWKWVVHVSKAGSRMLKVRYYGTDLGTVIEEYLTVLHPGRAGEIARRTMARIVGACGASIQLDSDQLEAAAAALTRAAHPAIVEYARDGKFFRVLRRAWADGGQLKMIG